MKIKSLGMRVAASSIVSIVTFGVIVGVYSLHKEKTYRIKAVHSEITKASSFLVQQAYILLKQPNDSALLNATQVVRQNIINGNFSYVEIIDAKKNLVVPYDPLGLTPGSKHGRVIHGGPWGTLALGNDHIILEEEYADTGPVIEGVFGIVESDRILGYVIMGVSKKPLIEALNGSMRMTFIILAVLLLATIFVAWHFGQLATKPVMVLANAIQGLRETDPLDSLNVNGSHEVRILSDSLRSYVSKTRRTDQELHMTIQEKTSALEKATSELKAMVSISNHMSKSMVLENVISALMESARQIVYCNEVYFFLRGTDEPRMISRQNGREPAGSVFQRFPQSYSQNDVEIVSKDLLNESLTKGVVDWIMDTRAQAYRSKVDPSIRSCVIFPIISASHVPLGVLFLGMTGDTPLNQDEINQLRVCMGTIGLTLDNVLLYSEKERLSRHDSMTGLLNRQSIMDALHREAMIAQRQHSSVFVLMADLDHFKKINDTFGHSAGDKVIREFSKIIGQHRRTGEYAGRYGGEEFLVVLPNCDEAAARVIAERIQAESNAARIPLEHHKPLSFTVSIGLASFPDAGDSVEDVLAKADRALYQAKANGRDTFVFWTPSIKTSPTSKLNFL